MVHNDNAEKQLKATQLVNKKITLNGRRAHIWH